MRRIPQKELRNNIGDVLRRAEAGEHITITVSGRAVADLGPTATRSSVRGAALEAIWASPAPTGLAQDCETFPGVLTDPFDA